MLQQNESVKYGVNIAERCSHAACYHPNGSMFVFGGCTAAYTTFNDLWRFDLATRSWSRPIPMGTFPTPKACATMVEYRGSLLLFGGWSKSSPNPIHQTAMFFNELHFYNPAQNIWTEVSSFVCDSIAVVNVAILSADERLFRAPLGWSFRDDHRSLYGRIRRFDGQQLEQRTFLSSN